MQPFDDFWPTSADCMEWCQRLLRGTKRTFRLRTLTAASGTWATYMVHYGEIHEFTLSQLLSPFSFFASLIVFDASIDLPLSILVSAIRRSIVAMKVFSSI